MASKESSLWLPAFYTRHEPFLNPSDLHGLEFSRTTMHVLCSCKHTATGVCPRNVQRNTNPSGLGSIGHHEPLRAASSARTPAEPSAGARSPRSPAALPSAGSGRALRAPSRTGQAPLSPRTGRPPWGYQTGSGWLRRARGAPARPGDGISALAVRLTRVRSPYEPPSPRRTPAWLVPRREGSPGRGGTPGRQLYPARGGCLPRWARRESARTQRFVFIYSAASNEQAVRASESHRARARRPAAAEGQPRSSPLGVCNSWSREIRAASPCLDVMYNLRC